MSRTKIGTYLKRFAAKDNGVPFYVALPSSSFDWNIRDGLNEIPIEERGSEEVSHADRVSRRRARRSFASLPSTVGGKFRIRRTRRNIRDRAHHASAEFAKRRRKASWRFFRSIAEVIRRKLQAPSSKLPEKHQAPNNKLSDLDLWCLEL